MIVDLTIITLLVVMIIRGAIRGFWLSLVGPISFTLATLLAFSCFKITNNVPVALAIGLIGPFLLAILFRYFFYIFRNDNAKKAGPNILSRILGAVIIPVWGMLFLIPAVYAISLLPPMFPILNEVQKEIRYSLVMEHVSNMIDPWLKSKGAPTRNTKTGTSQEPMANNNVIPSVSLSEDVMANLAQDQRIQDVINDPEIQKLTQEKNYAALMTNPKVMNLAQDPEFVKKILSALNENKKNAKP